MAYYYSIHFCVAFFNLFLINLLSIMTVAPPLSACLIIILSSFANCDMDFCTENVIFRLIFDFSVGTRGILVVHFIKVSSNSSLP